MRALAGTYSFATNVPLLGTVQVEVPVEEMMAEASPALAEAVRKEAKRAAPWLLAVGLGLTVTGAVIANLLVGRRR
jgi:NAD(P)H-hydrate repair Nnr-like enzyme with NAD(P)H-hydrate epimerase domain